MAGRQGAAVADDLDAVSVCLVTWNSSEDLPGCLDAVAGLRPAPVELIVVDCASDDDSPRVAADHAPAGVPTRIERLDSNLGFAGGMNRAFSLSRAPFILTLNPDARPSPDYAARLVQRIRRHPDIRVGAATGRLERPRETGRLDACGMSLTPAWRHFDRGSDEPDRGQFAKPERVFGATGAASLFRREALEDVKVGGDVFLPEFHSFREDAELCFRLRERGWEVLYEPLARAVHRRLNLPRRRREMTEQVNYHSLKNRYLLRAYHQTWGNLLLTLIPSLWRDCLAFGWVVLRERSSLPAYRWLWLHRRRILRRRRAIRERRLRPNRELLQWFFRRGLPI